MRPERTKGELAFIDQEARRLTAEWCRRAVELDTNEIVVSCPTAVMEHAVSKNWVTIKEEGRSQFRIRIKSGCWSTATSFLKR